MFLFGIAWLLAILVIVGAVLFVANLNHRVKTMEKNYEGNSIESLRKMVTDLQKTVANLTK